MYAYFRHVPVSKGIATLLTVALALWVVGAHMFTTAEAANLTYVNDTLSDSAPGSASNHDIQFLSPTGVPALGTVTISFPNGFNISTSSVDFNDIDMSVAGVDQTLTDVAPASGEWQVGIAGQDLTFTSGGGAAAIGSNATVSIQIGTNATGGTNQVTNHSATTSYEFTITTSSGDTGQYRVAIIENVLVTADVNTTLNFSVYGTSTGAVCNGADPTYADSSNVALAFGTLNAGVPKTLCQDLTVATNAIHGYIVTVMQDTQLKSSTGADIDGFQDGNWTTTPTAWAAPGNGTPDVLDENTWGHWGLTSSDSVTGRTAEFGANEWVAASTTPIIIMGHTGVADGSTDGIGRASIGYKIEISALQEAGDDYNTTLTYVATPTF